MYGKKDCVNSVQNFAQKEGSEYSPYPTVNVGEFAAAFLASKKEIIENELQRILAIVVSSEMQAMEFQESLDNIERQYYRAISITNADIKFKIFSSFRAAIEKEITGSHSAENSSKLQAELGEIKAGIFTEMQKALTF